MTVALEYGLRDGWLVHVSADDIPSGLPCGCTCPECGCVLVAKKGPVVADHFAHYGIGEPDAEGMFPNGCSGGLESAAHRLAKDIIAEARRLRFPLDAQDVERPIDSVVLEKALDASIRPDIQVMSGGRLVLVEIFVTHRCGEQKRQQLIEQTIASFEINLSPWHRRSLTDGFRDAVIFDARRTWIYDPDATARRLTLQQQAEEERQRQSEAEKQWQEESEALLAARTRELDEREAERQRQADLAEAARMRRDELVADIPRWAAAYYPSRIEPPPDLDALRLTDDEVVRLFDAVATRRAHLALVDQQAIRQHLSHHDVLAAIRASWQRTA